MGCVEGIAESFLEKLLEDLLNQLPFRIINFHSDNGSEFINKMVARLLNKLLVAQTKSRSRHCNDNALVECKNGAVIRKHMGKCHIPRKYAPVINEFYKEWFNVYLNYHRVCGFATDYVDGKGKIKKKYDVYLTPYEKLKLIDDANQYLNNTSFEELDKIAYAESDNDFAERMGKAINEMFGKLKNYNF